MLNKTIILIVEFYVLNILMMTTLCQNFNVLLCYVLISLLICFVYIYICRCWELVDHASFARIKEMNTKGKKKKRRHTKEFYMVQSASRRPALASTPTLSKSMSKEKAVSP